MSVEHLKELRVIIEYHNKAYYQNNNPEITDAEYDILFRELLDLEQQYPEEFSLDSPVLKVGAPALTEFKSYKHQYKMYSLNNVMSKNEFLSFFHTIMTVPVVSLATPSIVLEYKFDGLAIELVYKDRVLIEASTRGDGEIGELVTENVRTIRNIPLRLDDQAPNDLVIYGEIIIFKDDFKELNKNKMIKGEKVFANPRNAAAGSVRLLDSKQSATRKLQFYAYDCKTKDTNSSLILMNLHTHRMDYLKELGFSISPERKIIHAGNIHEAEMFYNEIVQKRDQLPFEIDGLVAKVIMDEIKDVLGYSDRAPKWAIAWKFEAEEIQTILLDIEYEVGRTGAITPVAILQPVELAGVVISRASLHNFDYIKDNDFRINDTVIIKRAGDVIPFVVKFVLEQRPANTQMIVEPELCPICKAKTVRDKIIGDEQARVLRCSDIACVGILKARLKYFVSKSGLNIDGFGDKIVEVLFDKGFLGSSENNYIDSFANIFKLEQHKEELFQLEGFGEKSITQLLINIDAKKSVDLVTFIQAFGIKGIGSVSADKLAKHFNNLDNLIIAYLQEGDENKKLQMILEIRNSIEETLKTKDKITIEKINQDINLKVSKKLLDEKLSFLRSQELLGVKPLVQGSSEIEDLIRFLLHTRYHQELKSLFDTDFKIVYRDKLKLFLGHNIFSGKKVLMTGKSQFLYSRQEILEFFDSLSIQMLPGVTKKLDYLIVGENPGAEKVKKAIELNITILQEKEFFDKLDPHILELYKNSKNL